MVTSFSPGQAGQDDPYKRYTEQWKKSQLPKIGELPTPIINANKYEPIEIRRKPYTPPIDPKFVGQWQPDYHIPQIRQRDPAPQGYYAPPRIEEPYHRWKMNPRGYVPIEIARLINPTGNPDLTPPDYTPITYGEGGGYGDGFGYSPRYSSGGGSSRYTGGYGLVNWRVGV